MTGKVINKGVSFGVDKLDNILSAFPQLNLIWLITGEGDMLLNGASPDRAPRKQPNSTDATPPLSGATDLKNPGLPEAEAAALAKDATATLNPVQGVATLERLLVLVENHPALPDADKAALLRPLHELRAHLFQSVNQVIASEARYRAALDAVQLLAAQLQAEAAPRGKQK